MNISELNEESEAKLARARGLVDSLEDVDLETFKAINAVLDAVETMFNTLSRPVMIDASAFMPEPKATTSSRKKKADEDKTADRLEAIKAKQYL